MLEGIKEQEAELQQLYTELLEKTMCYLRTVSLSCDQHKDKPGGMCAEVKLVIFDHRLKKI